MKHLAAVFVAVLVFVPSIARARQTITVRSDLKPTASFRDVDRPPEPRLDPPVLRAIAAALVPVLEPIAVLDPLATPLPRVPRAVRVCSLRAPPSVG